MIRMRQPFPLDFFPEHVIPAYPGFFTLALVDGSNDVWRTPVVGFAVDVDGLTTLPLGPHGALDDYQAIQYPNGTVEGFDRQWESVEAWLSDMKKPAGG